MASCGEVGGAVSRRFVTSTFTLPNAARRIDKLFTATGSATSALTAIALAAPRANGFYDGLGLGNVTGVVDHDGVPFGGETPRDGGADSARCTGNDGNLLDFLAHNLLTFAVGLIPMR